MKIKTGVVGLGYWGPNYVRNFAKHEQIELKWACDLQDSALSKIQKDYPQIKLTKNIADLLKDKDLNLIAIATPPKTHHKLCKLALNEGKHVLVAKPMATKSFQIEELTKIAKNKKLLFHCDLTYLYTSAVNTIKNLIEKGLIGQPLYYDSTRTNLGLIQKDVNVIWDLAPHDLAIIDYCFGLKAKKVYATGSKHHGPTTSEEMAHITVNYSNNFIAHIHVSWLSPIKLRTIFVGGSKKMILFDDVQPDEKIKIYDKGVILASQPESPFKPIYRSGEIIIPKIGNEEALFVETQYLVEQISKGKINYENAKLNTRITQILEACDKSLKTDRPVNF